MALRQRVDRYGGHRAARCAVPGQAESRLSARLFWPADVACSLAQARSDREMSLGMICASMSSWRRRCRSMRHSPLRYCWGDQSTGHAQKRRRTVRRSFTVNSGMPSINAIATSYLWSPDLSV